MEAGQSISVINTGFLPFIPFTTQYKMGLTGGRKDFLVPTTKNLSEVGKAGKLQWGWQASQSNSILFKPNIDAYNAARAGQDRNAEPGYGLYDEKLESMQEFGSEKFQEVSSRGRKATDQLHEDLKFTPNLSMAKRSAAMAAELANVIESAVAPASTSKKEDAEMEEEAILDLFYESEVPELRAIMQEARAKAESGKTSIFSNEQRNAHGLSPETYDWTIKDVEDLTKMHALVSVLNQNMHGKLLSDNIIGLEVTKDKKFFAIGREGKDYGGNNREEKTKRFLEDTQKEMQTKFDAINKEITIYMNKTGGMWKEMTGGTADKPDTLKGFTQQTISRARETLLHPGGKQNTYGFQFPMGTREEGGPYQVVLEIIPVFDQGNILQSINHTVGIIEMAGYEGARAKLQPGISSTLLKHVHGTLNLGNQVTEEIIDRAAILVGTELQLSAGRGSMLGTRFQTDFGMRMADSYIAYTTMTSTMTSKEVSDSLHELISGKANDPEQAKALKEVIEGMFNDSEFLTEMWKDKVGGDRYTVSDGMAWANEDGPWSAGVGKGVGITPFMGSSSQMNLIESLQKTPKGQTRVGQAIKNPHTRMRGQKPTPTQALRDWMSSVYEGGSKFMRSDMSKVGMKDVYGDGSVMTRENWFTKHQGRLLGKHLKIKQLTSNMHKDRDYYASSWD